MFILEKNIFFFETHGHTRKLVIYLAWTQLVQYEYQLRIIINVFEKYMIEKRERPEPEETQVQLTLLEKKRPPDTGTVQSKSNYTRTKRTTITDTMYIRGNNLESLLARRPFRRGRRHCATTACRVREESRRVIMVIH
jgi:hypothetical protein